MKRLFGALAIAALLPACSAAIGVGAAAAVTGAAALAHTCYDFVDIQVVDAVTGSRICDAEVTAEHDGSSDTLQPCYHAHLSEGTWTVRATRPGYAESSTQVTVSHPEECNRTVQSLSLSLTPSGVIATAPVPITPPAAPAPAPQPAPAPAPGPAAPPSPAETPASPTL